MSKILFVSKEHYLTFRKAWAAAVNDSRAKRTIVYHKFPARTYPLQGLTLEETISGEVIPGWLTAAHHLLFNILCDREPHAGFVPIHDKQKLIHGSCYINHGYYCAIHNLRWRVDKAKEILYPFARNKYFNRQKQMGRWQREITSKFLEPFNGTITVDMLAEVEVPEVKEIIPTWGVGEAIAKKIIDGNRYSIAELNQMLRQAKRIETRKVVGRTTVVDYEYVFEDTQTK